jgi:hypothetical protein
VGWRVLEVNDAAVKGAVGDRSEAGGAGSSGALEAVAVVWLSQPGVTAHAHFDKSHNFLTQVPTKGGGGARKEVACVAFVRQSRHVGLFNAFRCMCR